MSVYGGDSWAPDVYCRKRRIDLFLSDQLHKSHSQKLSNGKYTCLICSNRPVLDTLSMLTMHNQGTRHQAAASKLKEKEICKQEEIKKRIALSEASTTSNVLVNNPIDFSGSFKCPLLEKTRKGTAGVLTNGNNALGNALNPNADCNSLKEKGPFFASLHAKNVKGLDQKTYPADCHHVASTDVHCNVTFFVQSNSKVISNIVHEQQLEFQKQREMELKFREAGWRRDGRGGWFREENVSVLNFLVCPPFLFLVS
ncbi:hypothetical protein KI387_019729 [Taxus chinensis]|uniref:Sodium channel modifier 1 zinc-finger domain-containing protein n=1 Tax=Taxus chinensis TaxID=29808 RepID=A0AA38LDR1_TAXCH|nr:hypothetical protein KI387_019729 [Taxus chinensis]